MILYGVGKRRGMKTSLQTFHGLPELHFRGYYRMVKPTGHLLQHLRSLLKKYHVDEGVQAYLIPSEDAHQVWKEQNIVKWGQAFMK